MNKTSQRIADTELILTDRGTIYHLDLAPENVAHTIITVGSPDRVKEVSKHFDSITFKGQHREFITHTGYIGSRQITVVSTGIGTGNIDIVFNELDALVNIDFETRTIKKQLTTLNIFRLGTCGTLQEDIPVDSLILSTFGIGLDNVLLYYDYANDPEETTILSELWNHAYPYMGSIKPYIGRASTNLMRYFGPLFISGITISCPGFYAPQGRSLRLSPALPHLIESLTSYQYQDARILNLEMETAAMYGLGKLLGHQCISISAALANRSTKTFSANPDKTIEKMIVHSLEIITGVP